MIRWGNVHNLRNTSGQRYITKSCKSIGICTVFCYKGGGKSEILENHVT